MKILYTTLYHPHFSIGGAEKILFDLASEISQQYGEEILFAVNRGELFDAAVQKQFKTKEIFYPKSKTIQTVLSLRQMIADFKPDIIHSFHRYPSFLLDLFFRKKAIQIYTEEVLRKDKKRFFRYGDKLVACHETVKKNLEDYYGVPKHDLITIPNAVPKRTATAEEVLELSHLYPKKEQMFALCVARLEEQKGHCYLVDAVSLLPDVYKRRLKIFLAGDGSLEKELNKQVQDQNVSDCFVFLGHTQKVGAWLEICDFMVLPSLWEGLPLCILESYAAGKPVLATNIPGNRESIQNNKTGLLVDARDPQALSSGLIHFIDHHDLNSMGKRAFDLWEKEFSFQKMISAYRDLYQQLLDQKKT